MKTHTVTRINAKAPDHGSMFAPGREIQLNADGSLPEWIQLAPFGEHPTRDRKAVQRFNAEAAAQILSWFNFWPKRIARQVNFNTVKVWVGHPDFAPNEWPERVELGSITELNADEHGLNGKIEWNAGAADHVKKHKYPSVAWECDVLDGGIEQPTLLWSVGMWHQPNIKSVKPVINACACEEEDKQDEQKIENSPFLGKLAAALREAGLIKEDESEDIIYAAVGSALQTVIWKREEEARNKKLADEVRVALNAEATAADDTLPGLLIERFNAATGKLADLQRQLDEHEAWRKSRINAVITGAIEKGLLTKAEEPEMLTRLNADFDGGLASLLAKRVQLNSSSLDLGRTKPAISDAAQRATRLNAWLDEYQAKHDCDRDTAWKASQADTEMRGIHEQMSQADKARSGTPED